ncbi:MAG: DUF1848 domain-containing protein [Geobacteraceae bacterium]|nr:DUF1848 domain-containing protein [Geobacteraceae bacterium]
MAIISASRRTDIPAFYSDWFMKRIRAGYFYRVNPFNLRQASRVSLMSGDVDAIVFWSKNPGPLARHLDELDDLGYSYYFQFTLNPYEAGFEPHLQPLEERIAVFGGLAGRLGPGRVIWRYDPIILSSSTPVAYHLEQAERLAIRLEGATERMMFSFLSYYGKVAGRLKKLQEQTGIGFTDIRALQHREELLRLAQGLKAIATSYSMQIYSCAEELDLSQIGIEHGSCVDGGLISELFGSSRQFTRDKHQRSACGCAASVDMGMYDSCPFRCPYCYANKHDAAIEANMKRHNPESASLLHEYEVEKASQRDLFTG